MIWSIEGHPLLDPPDLTGNELKEQTELAEFVLGLRGKVPGDFDPAQTADLRRALALQVSLQVAADVEAYLAKSVGRSGESVTYRDGIILHPTALAIVEGVLTPPAPDSGGLAGDYLVVASLR